MRQKIRWYDWLVYRLFYWRWNRILANNHLMRELIINWLKSYDVLDEGDKITVSINR